MLEKYTGVPFSCIESSQDLAALKKGLALPASKQLKWTFRRIVPVDDVMIEEIYKPSYSCRLCTILHNGDKKHVLSDCFADMQKTAKNTDWSNETMTNAKTILNVEPKMLIKKGR